MIYSSIDGFKFICGLSVGIAIHLARYQNRMLCVLTTNRRDGLLKHAFKEHGPGPYVLQRLIIHYFHYLLNSTVIFHL